QSGNRRFGLGRLRSTGGAARGLSLRPGTVPHPAPHVRWRGCPSRLFGLRRHGRLRARRRVARRDQAGRGRSFLQLGQRPARGRGPVRRDAAGRSLLLAAHPARRRHYLGIAGGSGITPMLSLVETTLATEVDSRFTLVYGNRDGGSIMFLERIEALKNRYMTRFNRIHLLSEEIHELRLFHGLLDEIRAGALLDALAPPEDLDHVFVCGPEPMMAAAEAALHARGVGPERISIERFGVPAPPRPAVPVVPGTVVDEGPVAEVSI